MLPNADRKCLFDPPPIQLSGKISQNRLRTAIWPAQSGILSEATGRDIGNTTGILLDKLGEVASYTIGVDEDRDKADLRKLAELGRDLFDRIIPTEEQKDFLNRLGIALDSERPMSLPDVRARVALRDEALKIPWSLLYLGDLPPESDPDLRLFLGRHFLFIYAPELEIVGTSGTDINGEDALNDISWEDQQSSKRVALGYIWDDEFLKAGLATSLLWTSVPSPIKRFELEVLESGDLLRDEMEHKLKSFVFTARDFLHFDCHSPTTSGHYGHSGDIQMRKKFQVSNADLSTWAFLNNPDVFATLNICKSAQALLEIYDSSIAQRLVQQGLAGVIAPFSVITAEAAMGFSKRFYASGGFDVMAEARDTKPSSAQEFLRDYVNLVGDILKE